MLEFQCLWFDGVHVDAALHGVLCATSLIFIISTQSNFMLRTRNMNWKGHEEENFRKRPRIKLVLYGNIIHFNNCNVHTFEALYGKQDLFAINMIFIIITIQGESTVKSVSMLLSLAQFIYYNPGAHIIK